MTAQTSHFSPRPQIRFERTLEVGDRQQVRPRFAREGLGDRVPRDAALTGELGNRPLFPVDRGLEPGSKGLGNAGAVMFFHDSLRPRAAGAVSARRQSAGISLRHEVQSDSSGPPKSRSAPTSDRCYSNSIPPAGVLVWRHVMSQRINSYRPAGSPAGWSRVGDEVRRVVLIADPLTSYKARELLTALAQLALFCNGEGLPAAAEVWLSREVIERFIAVGCPQVSEGTRGNYRTRLLRLREILFGGECRTGSPARLSAATANRPYTGTELADLWGWAGGQPTEELRWGCKTLMGLGAGVGLDSTEIIPLRTHDVRRPVHEEGPVVVATRGNRKRDIVCRRPWEGVLAASAKRLETPGTARYLFRPNCYSRGTNTVTNFLSRTKRSSGVPRLVMGRLRATWLLALFEERLPITVIVAAAGVDTLHGLSRILPYLPGVSPEEAASLLRGKR